MWDADIDIYNMHNLGLADFFAMGMDIDQASSFLLYTQQSNKQVWPVGDVEIPEESSSETESYESFLSLPE